MIDSSFIEKIESMAGNGAVLHEDQRMKHVLVNGDIRTIDKEPVARNHSFTSLEGFIDYLNSPRSGVTPGIIFVNPDKVRAELDYMSEIRQTATLNLDESEEMVALHQIISGIGQKTLWRELITRLRGCIDPALALQISNLKIQAKSDSDLQIQRLGLENKSSVQALRITFNDPGGKGTHTADVQQNWVWTGRIWECWDQPVEIPLTMEIDTAQGLAFVFHPDRIKTRIRDARVALAKVIASRIDKDRFTVHEGSF